MVDMVAKAKALILGMLASAATTAATVDLTLPPGDYMLVPVQPYTVVTIQSTPVDPPVLDTDGDGVNDDLDQCPNVPGVEPDGCPLPPADTDGDGVVDDVDQCPNTPAGDEVDATGCTVVVVPPPTGSDAEMVAAILSAAPPQHPTEARFSKIPGSEIDVLVQCDEFSYGNEILCYKSFNAFIDWTGGAWNWSDWEFAQPAGGGHADYWGNELYLARLAVESGSLALNWSRPIDPVPMIDPECRNNPVSGPSASHTYASPVYVDSQDAYFFATDYSLTTMDGATECQQLSQPSWGGWYTDGESYTQVMQSPPHVTSYGRACYLRNDDKVYMFTGGNQYNWTISPSDGWAVEGGRVINYVSNAHLFDTAADQNNEICYVYWKGIGVTGHTNGWGANVFTSTSKVMDVESLSVEHSTGNLVIVGTEGRVIHIDVHTKEERDISSTEGGIPYAGETAENIFGKFDMIEKIPCVGIGMADPRDGVYLMTLPANVCTMGAEPPPPVVVGPPEPTQPPVDVAFIEQCVLSGALFCDPLSTYGPYAVDDGALTVLTNPDGSEGVYEELWWRKWRGVQEYDENSLAGYDAEQDALRVVKKDGSSDSGLFVTNFSKDLNTKFKEGDTFWVQFQFRYNCDYVYMDCDPNSPTYKTDRRPFPRGGELQGSKIAILAEGDNPDRPANACMVSQVVPYQTFGEVRAFNYCGKYMPIEKSTGKVIGGSMQIARQPGGEHTCFRMPDDATRVFESWDAGGTGPDCALIDSDEWMTLRMRVTITDWDEPVNRFEMWFAREGLELRKVIDQNIELGDPGVFEGYGKIWLQMHSTYADTNIGEPDKIAWYRNLMVGAGA